MKINNCSRQHFLWRLFLSFLVSFSHPALAQRFTLSDSLTSPSAEWQGDTAKMNFTPFGLRTQDSDAGECYWYRPSRAALNATWSLEATLEFNPSSSNYCEWHVLTSGQNAYLLQLGGGTTDDLSFILRRASGDTVLAKASQYLQGDPVALALTLTRDSTYTFELYDGAVHLFSVQDSSLKGSTGTAIYSKYTKTRATKFLFRQLSIDGMVFIDSIAPRLLGYTQTSPSSLLLHWSEPTLPHLAAGALNGVHTARDTALFPNLAESHWAVQFNRPLERGIQTLFIASVTDTAGNVRAPQQLALDWHYVPAKSAHLMAVQPFDGVYPPFYLLKCPPLTGEATVQLQWPNGALKHYHFFAEDTMIMLTKLGNETAFEQWPLPVVAIEDLKVECEVVWSLLHDGLYLEQCYIPDHFEASVQQGAHALVRSDSLWEISTVPDLPTRTWRLERAKKNSIKAVYRGANGTFWLQFTRPVFDHIAPPGSDQGTAPLPVGSETWEGERPFFLPLRSTQHLPWCDTTLVYRESREAEPGAVWINEVHFQPDTGDEYVELWVPDSTPRYLQHAQWLLLDEHGQTADVAPAFAIEPTQLFVPPNFAQEWSVLLLPQAYHAIKAPFRLPNEPSQLRLTSLWGAALDSVVYSVPNAVEPEHHSWERASHSPELWGWHVPKLGQQTTHSIGTKNSLQGTPADKDPWAYLARNYFVDTPSRSEGPLLHLRGTGSLDIGLLDKNGMLVDLLMQDETVLGENKLDLFHHIARLPLANGLYFLHLKVRDEGRQRSAILPFSVFR